MANQVRGCFFPALFNIMPKGAGFIGCKSCKIKNMTECIFCKIAQHQVSSSIVAEDEVMIVFKDIHPKAETHWLIVPKKHIHSVSAVESDDWPLVASLIKKAAETARGQGINGYKLVFNVGREGGQMVDHLHLHLLAGGKIELP